MRKKIKLCCTGIGLSLILGMVLVFSFREKILIAAGNFMAPETNSLEGPADVVILEGTEFIGITKVSKGLEILSSGRARRMVLVLHRIHQTYRPFAITENYPSSVHKELQRLGLNDSDFTVIVSPLRDPITLTTAQFVIDRLSREGVKKAILVSSGFHTRRSYLVYQHLASPLNITIYPLACFDAYPLKNWWNEGHGARHFFGELQKLVAYLVMGYIPPRLSY